MKLLGRAEVDGGGGLARICCCRGRAWPRASGQAALSSTQGSSARGLGLGVDTEHSWRCRPHTGHTRSLGETLRLASKYWLHVCTFTQ